MKKLLIIVLIFISVYGYTENIHVQYGYPKGNKSGDLLHRKGYVLLHIPEWKIPLWVAYHISITNLYKIYPRKNSFKPDPDLISGRRAELKDYLKSGFDRGHMFPAALTRYNKQVMKESFYLSNMTPQSPSFNRGIWKQLEAYIRDIVKVGNELWVVSGVIMGDQNNTIGKGKVRIPRKLYKVVLVKGEKLYMLAFIIPNENIKDYANNHSCSVDKVEEITGIDFFSSLPDEIENILEK